MTRPQYPDPRYYDAYAARLMLLGALYTPSGPLRDPLATAVRRWITANGGRVHLIGDPPVAGGPL